MRVHDDGNLHDNAEEAEDAEDVIAGVYIYIYLLPKEVLQCCSAASRTQ